MEKEKWTKVPGEGVTPVTLDGAAWEKEKAELIMARDEATGKLKVSLNRILW